ncbi:MAG: hypothetical protein WCC60_13705, partial [Ilumatobacteraceae bacterium]
TLTALARVLQRTSVLGLHLAAGSDTWVGPSPQACLDDLRSRRGRLLQLADELLAESRRFVRIADDLEAKAATLPGVR